MIFGDKPTSETHSHHKVVLFSFGSQVPGQASDVIQIQIANTHRMPEIEGPFMKQAGGGGGSFGLKPSRLSV